MPEEMPEEMPDIYGVSFTVDESPHCVWDCDPRQLNIDYLNSIDPSYFERLAKFYGQHLEGEERQHAAIALRMAYSQGLESLFALICAAVQSPDCVVGWLLQYKITELESVVKKISDWHRVNSKVKLDRITWESLAAAFTPFNTGDAEKDARIKGLFATLWSRFAHDFLDEKKRGEYNSIKHGLRIYMGGFSFAMGLEDTPGVPAPPERMQLVEQSDFGSSYYVAERLHKHNLRIRRQSVNWNPENFFHALSLISTSMTNVLGWLKAVNGVPTSEITFLCPDDESYFEEPWKRGSSMSVSMNSTIDPSFITPRTKDEILSVYKQKGEDTKGSAVEGDGDGATPAESGNDLS